MKKLLIVMVLCFALTGCLKEKAPGVYGLDIEDNALKSKTVIGQYAEEVRIPPEHHDCDACGKDMTYEKDGTTWNCYGVDISFFYETDDEYREFYQQQMGGYELNKHYRICWECWLSSLGAKP